MSIIARLLETRQSVRYGFYLILWDVMLLYVLTSQVCNCICTVNIFPIYLASYLICICYFITCGNKQSFECCLQLNCATTGVIPLPQEPLDPFNEGCHFAQVHKGLTFSVALL